ncbi:hypothetical protein SBRCBS47491_003081 [Sporothrix bragantina]|uniref:Uncharacterized protein n=1 Tax=Sporothrix bragantina TaxID=671064 RepID=A0ABP0BCG9_9PEZI
MNRSHGYQKFEDTDTGPFQDSLQKVPVNSEDRSHGTPADSVASSKNPKSSLKEGMQLACLKKRIAKIRCSSPTRRSARLQATQLPAAVVNKFKDLIGQNNRAPRDSRDWFPLDDHDQDADDVWSRRDEARKDSFDLQLTDEDMAFSDREASPVVNPRRPRYLDMDKSRAEQSNSGGDQSADEQDWSSPLRETYISGGDGGLHVHESGWSSGEDAVNAIIISAFRSGYNAGYLQAEKDFILSDTGEDGEIVIIS